MSTASSRSAPASAAQAADAVRTFVHAHADAYVDVLRRLACAESPSTDPDAQADVQGPIARALRALGYRTVHLPGDATGGCLYARPASSPAHAARQLLLGHSDTVWSHGTRRRMPVQRDGDTLRGPGVFDMKAGLTSIVFALRALDALHLTPPATPLVLITSDEEIGSHESQRHIERLARCSTRAFVVEPALGLEGKLKTARKSTGEYALTLHASGPSPRDRSADVVAALSRLVQRLHALNDPAQGVTVNVGTIDSQPHPNGATGRLAVDVRVRTVDDAQRIDETIRSLTLSSTALRLHVSGGMERKPLERTPRNRSLWKQAQQLGTHLDLDLQEGRAGGGSDGNITSLYTATLDGLGAVGDGAHANHEYVDIPRTLDRCALLALLLMAPLQAQ